MGKVVFVPWAFLAAQPETSFCCLVFFFGGGGGGGGVGFFFAVRKRGFVPEPSRGKKCLSPLGLLGPELRARQNRASAGGNFANPGVITAGPH